jgi:hypothetical protein
VRVSGDEILELGNYTIDSPEDVLKHIPDWKDSVVTDDSAFKRYIEGELCPHFHLWVWTAGPDGERDFGNYCIVIGSAIRGENALGYAHCGRSIDVLGRDCIDLSPVVEHVAGDEQFMFVSRIQFLKPPEKIILWIRTVVRLQRGDLCESVRMNTAQPAPSACVESVNGLINREHDVAIRKLTASETPRKVIESGSCVVNAISGDQTQPSDGKRLPMLDPDVILGMFRIEFDNQFVRLAFQETGDFFVKGLKMFLSTNQFVPTFDQG